MSDDAVEEVPLAVNEPYAPEPDTPTPTLDDEPLVYVKFDVAPE